METQNLVLDRMKALQLYRDYKKHSHWSAPIDREIQRTYQLIAQGRLVIKALDSIKAAGLGLDGLPKLAIVRADATVCDCRVGGHGDVEFDIAHKRSYRTKTAIALPEKTFSVVLANPRAPWESAKRGRAIVPLIPIEHRPRRGIQNYHILWEADWKAVPVDPMLLRRIGKGDLWLVVAAWDLTEIERAALAARVTA